MLRRFGLVMGVLVLSGPLCWADREFLLGEPGDGVPVRIRLAVVETIREAKLKKVPGLEAALGMVKELFDERYEDPDVYEAFEEYFWLKAVDQPLPKWMKHQQIRENLEEIDRSIGSADGLEANAAEVRRIFGFYLLAASRLGAEKVDWKKKWLIAGAIVAGSFIPHAFLPEHASAIQAWALLLTGGTLLGLRLAQAGITRDQVVRDERELRVLAQDRFGHLMNLLEETFGSDLKAVFRSWTCEGIMTTRNFHLSATGQADGSALRLVQD